MAKRQRRIFSTEFKHDAASLVLDQGYSFAEACRAVDVHENTLRNWVQPSAFEFKAKASIRACILATEFTSCVLQELKKTATVVLYKYTVLRGCYGTSITRVGT
ncbi:hypothetical protein CWI69_12220 [Pseudidiomarina halophila]|uniref:Transposase n=1 Tax=Pseudidiomarina halophila TaxID=1449799 RepID=A0A432XR15_9GAMM|nr:hypothetical protein CWI69_12220 [Pseudidiomarina halophila]